MEAVLKFNLPEDRDNYTLASKGADLYHVLWEFNQQSLRRRIKYEVLSEEQYKLVEDIRDELWELLNEKGIDLYSLVE